MDFFIIIDSASATQSVTSEGSVVIARETDKTEIMICYENFFFFFLNFWIFETFNPNLGLWRENLPPLLPLPVIPK